MSYKKTLSLLEAKECVRFQFLKENQNRYNIKKACKILRISRSGYYDFLQRKKSKRIIENEALTEMIEDIFHGNSGRYGARRIQQVLEQKLEAKTHWFWPHLEEHPGSQQIVFFEVSPPEPIERETGVSGVPKLL